MSAKNVDEAPKRTTSIISERFASNKAMPAPDPPKSAVEMESAKNTKIIKTKHYSHHKHTRHVTEDEKIYETVTTTSKPTSITRTTYTTTHIDGPSKSHERYYEKNVRLVNTEDNCKHAVPPDNNVMSENRKTSVPKEPTMRKEPEEPPPPPPRSVSKRDPALNASHDSIYKTAANTISDLASVANFSVKSFQMPPRLADDNRSIRSASASMQFNAEYEKLGEIFGRWQELREELNNNSDSLQNMQDELIRQFTRVDQLRQLAGRRTPSVASLAVRQPEKVASCVPTPVPSIQRLRDDHVLRPSLIQQKPEEQILPADPNHNIVHQIVDNVSVRSKTSAQHVHQPTRVPDNNSVKSITPVEQVQHIAPPDNASVRSKTSVHYVPIHLTDNVSIHSKVSAQPKIPGHAGSKTPSVRSLSHNQQVHAPVKVPDTVSHDYIPVLDEWKPVYNGSLHHAQTLPNQRDNHDYESIKSLPLTKKEPHKAVQTAKHATSGPASLHEEDIKSVHSRRSVNNSNLPQPIFEEVKSERSAKHQVEHKSASIHEDTRSEKSIKHHIEPISPLVYEEAKFTSKPPSVNGDARSLKSAKAVSRPPSIHHHEVATHHLEHKPPSVNGDARSVKSNQTEIKPPSIHHPEVITHHLTHKVPSVHNEDAHSLKSTKAVSKPPSIHHHEVITHHLEHKPPSVNGDAHSLKSTKAVSKPPSIHHHEVVTHHIEKVPSVHNEDAHSVKSNQTESKPPSLFQDVWLTKVASYKDLPRAHEHDEDMIPIKHYISSFPQHEDDNKSVKSTHSTIYAQPPQDDAKSTTSKKSFHENSKHVPKVDPDEIVHPEPVYIDNASEHIYQAPNSVIGDSHHYETVADNRPDGMHRPDHPAPSIPPVAPPLPDFAQLKPPMRFRPPSIPVSAPKSTTSEQRSPGWDDVMRDIRASAHKRLSEEDNTA